MKKSLFQKFLCILLSIPLLAAFSLPASATPAATVPSGGFFQMQPNNSSVTKLTDGRLRLCIDEYDVVVVKQSTTLVVWTMNSLSSADQDSLMSTLNDNKLGVSNNPSFEFFSGLNTYSGANPLGTYQVTKESGHYYIYISSLDKISHFILHKRTIQDIKVTKIVSGESAPKQAFSFVLKDGAAQVGTASITGAGTVTFQLKEGYLFPPEGVTLEMTEVVPDPQPLNWTYSQAKYYVLIDGFGNVRYQDENKRAIIGIPTFTNTYARIECTVKAHKDVVSSEGSVPASYPTFTFHLYNAGNQAVGTASIGGTGDVTFKMNEGFVLPPSGITLTMKEDIPSPVPTGWVYSSLVYTVTITGAGQVSYSYEDENGRTHSVETPIFTNEYEASTPPSYVIKAQKKVTGDTPSSYPTFTFRLYDSEKNQVGSASIAGAGEVVFTLKEGFTPTSETVLTMKEDLPDPLPEGWTYDSATYYVKFDAPVPTLRLVAQPSLQISYYDSEQNPIEGIPVFENSYKKPVTPKPIQVSKVIEGNPKSIPTFQFILKNDDGIQVGSASIDHEGIVTFTMENGFQIPEYGLLTMSEVIPANVPKGWTYSDAVYYVMFDENGNVSYMTRTEESVDIPVFINTYDPGTVEFTVQAKKAVDGTPETMPDFSFSLMDGKTKVGSASRSGAGDLTFTMNEDYVLPEGGATLTMTEDVPANVPDGWTYSKASFTVTIDAQGNVQYKDNSSNKSVEIPVFTNVYEKPPVSFTVQAKKAVSGTPETMPDFSFSLYSGETKVGSASRSGAGDLTFTMNADYVLPEGGATLTMKEDIPADVPAGWTYSTASFTVAIDAKGKVQYKDGSGKNVELPVFTNTYAVEEIPEEPTPYVPPETTPTPTPTPTEVISEEETPLASPQTGESGNGIGGVRAALLLALTGGWLALAGIRRAKKMKSE